MTKAELGYTADQGVWEKRRWEQAPAELAGNRASATLPEGTTVFFLNLLAADGQIVSSEHVDLTLRQ